MIEVKNIAFKYPKSDFKLVVKDLTIERGKVIALVGGNGCGKTTLLRLMCGIYQSDDTQVIYQNKQYKSLIELPLRLVMHNAYAGLNPSLTILQQTKLVAKLYGEKHPVEKIRSVAEQLNVTELLHKKPHELSAGQKQRSMLLRTLSVDPDVILLDEPTTGLDIKAIEQIMGWIDFLKSKGKTIIISTHHPYELSILSPRIIGLHNGNVVTDKQSNKAIQGPDWYRDTINKIIEGVNENA
ncbi:ABC transporter ATP-binding protein [Thalassotalea piscium]|uniref:ABC-type multidrug transport system ATPase subunit n=1 Tax=Thalassotalea piscium TaxID=1230533 RepID=A0A7X0TUV3_9GAMM|nr:ABC transporter ATP-binding protein [Thalassotalea piscium]MBB6544787.1 ABC-type multidrug transport system ATPase subunit [Thalassotalea piscium]